MLRAQLLVLISTGHFAAADRPGSTGTVGAPINAASSEAQVRPWLTEEKGLQLQSLWIIPTAAVS